MERSMYQYLPIGEKMMFNELLQLFLFEVVNTKIIQEHN